MKTNFFAKVIDIFTVIFVFLFPLFFAPFLLNSYEMGKQIYLLVFSLVLFLLWSVKSVFEKRLTFQKNSFFIVLLLVFASSLISTLLNAPNKPASFASVTGAGSLLLLLLTFILISNLGKIKLLLTALLGSAAVISLISLILFLGNFTFPINYPSLNLSITKTWSPTGSLLGQMIFLLIVVPIGFGLVYDHLRNKNLLLAGTTFVVNVLVLVGLGINVYLLTTTNLILLSQGTAWAVAVEGLKTSRFALFGLGPGQFLNAFTAFKPLGFNSSENWNLAFTSSSNWYFQLLTEVGLVGLAVYIFLTVIILKSALKTLRNEKPSVTDLSIYLSLIIIIITQIFLPLNLFLMAVFFILLALVGTKDIYTEGSQTRSAVEFNLQPLGKLAGLVFVLPLIILLIVSFFAGKIALANRYFLQSLIATNQNDGVKTYNLQIKAIQIDPASLTYRIAYSQTNLALANSLATKTDLTDNDRSTITQLVQQSIREAKAAVAIDPRNVSAWENLATIYRNLVNFAEGADQWTVSAYQQAIQLDPLNPNLRIDFGGFYYSLKNFDQAITLFAQAVNLKPDLANAHYNLANALREKGNYVDAKSQYEVAQTLVKIDSPDYQKVTVELEEVNKRIPSPQPTPKISQGSPETLSKPTPPAAGIKPPLELPNEGPVISPTP